MHFTGCSNYWITGEARVEAVEGFPGGMERPQKSSFVFLMMFLGLSQKEHVDDVFRKKLLSEKKGLYPGVGIC